MDPLAGTAWSSPSTVSGFVRAAPNMTLMAGAARELQRLRRRGVAVDIGCGAGRNAVPLAGQGWFVVGTDLSTAMLAAARERMPIDGSSPRYVHAAMDAVPLATHCADLVIAHGIWNLARTDAEFTAAVADAARVAKGGALLFVFTFSRATLPAAAAPEGGQTYVFTGFSGTPQSFLTPAQLIAELGAVGFTLEPGTSVRELNRPAPGALPQAATTPIILEAMFRKR